MILDRTARCVVVRDDRDAVTAEIHLNIRKKEEQYLHDDIWS